MLIFQMLCFSFGMGPKMGVSKSNINSRNSLFHFVTIHSGIVRKKWGSRVYFGTRSGLSIQAQDDRMRHITKRGDLAGSQPHSTQSPPESHMNILFCQHILVYIYYMCLSLLSHFPSNFEGSCLPQKSTKLIEAY